MPMLRVHFLSALTALCFTTAVSAQMPGKAPAPAH